MVVIHSLPEGFESLVLSCKRIYGLCTPFLEHHNTLRWHFQNFHYCKTNKPFKLNQELLTFRDTISSAFNLIARITIEPVVAHYIQEADFGYDSRLGQGLDSRWTTHRYYCDQAVRELFANSSYLAEAGLDWKQYYATVVEDHNAGRYSQHAAVFWPSCPTSRFSDYPDGGSQPRHPTSWLILLFTEPERCNLFTTSLAWLELLNSRKIQCRDLIWMACFLFLPCQIYNVFGCPNVWAQEVDTAILHQNMFIVPSCRVLKRSIWGRALSSMRWLLQTSSSILHASRYWHIGIYQKILVPKTEISASLLQPFSAKLVITLRRFLSILESPKSHVLLASHQWVASSGSKGLNFLLRLQYAVLQLLHWMVQNGQLVTWYLHPFLNFP